MTMTTRALFVVISAKTCTITPAFKISKFIIIKKFCTHMNNSELMSFYGIFTFFGVLFTQNVNSLLYE